MKKSICYLLLTLAVFNFAACGSVKKIELPPLPTVTPEISAEENVEAAPTPDLTEKQPNEEKNGPIIVRFKNTTLNGYDPQNGEKLILTFSYDTPVVSISGREDAADKINEFTAKHAEAFYTGEDFGEGYGTGYMNMLTSAEDEYNYLANIGSTDDMYEESATENVRVSRADDKVFSVIYSDYYYLGGAHGTTVERAYNFNAETGELLRLEDLTDDIAQLKETVLNQIVSMIEDSDEDKEMMAQYWGENPDYRAIVEPILREGSWYLDRYGIVFFADVYEINSYAAGTVGYRIAYYSLGDCLKPEWVAHDREPEGGFKLVTPEEFTDGTVEILDMVKAAGEGETLYIQAVGKIYDVTISTVGYADNFYEKELHWYCSEMEDNAVQLETMIPDGMPNLKISWTDSWGGQLSNLISQSGEDGSYILVSDNIEAVG